MNFTRALRSAGSPLGRVELLEKLTERLLWRLPDPERYLELAPRLPETALANAKLYPDREAMLHALPKGGTVGEIGVWKGDFSRDISRICGPDRFHLIDIDFTPFQAVAGPVEMHQGDSSTILGRFGEATFDWLYIDGDHSYAGVQRDLAASHRALKPCGYLMCNDYANWCSLAVAPYGVARAVNEFIVREGYSVEGLALHPAGLPDILIRKPA
jgi:hypothetical protein